MWQAFDAGDMEQTLRNRAQLPVPATPPKASFWHQVGEFLTSPLEGAAQGVNQSLRVLNTVVSVIPGGSPEIRARNAEVFEAIDEQLRSNTEYWTPDPIASTAASQFVHQGARILTKVAGYSLAGGVPGAVVGTGLDEGVTGYQELRDQGVDRGTATKVGLVRGGTMAVGVALPVVGGTGLRTLGLVGVSGAAFMGEQAASREILAAAQYPELASQFDPFDPVGLGLSFPVPGAVGIGAHVVRRRRAALARALNEPEAVEAAHVVFRDDQLKASTLADPDDLVAIDTHLAQTRAAARAMEADEPVSAAGAPIAPEHAQAAMQQMLDRLEAAPRQELDEVIPPAEAPGLAQPDLLIRMDEHEPAMPARDMLDAVRAEAERARLESKAYRAAIECAIRSGT